MDLSSPIRAPSRETPHTRLLPLLAILVAPLAACESEIAAPGEEVFEEGELSFDASSPTDFVYLNLAGGTRVSPSDPAASTEWHMAFRRFSVRLNSGVSGPGSVSGYNLGNNASSSADQVIALTPEDGEAAFQAFTEADIPGSSAFVEDGLAPDPGSSWFRFDPQAGDSGGRSAGGMEGAGEFGTRSRALSRRGVAHGGTAAAGAEHRIPAPGSGRHPGRARHRRRRPYARPRVRGGLRVPSGRRRRAATGTLVSRPSSASW